MWKKLITLLMACLALLGLCMPALAQEKEGVLQIVLKEPGTVRMLPIASYEDGVFVMNEGWSGYDLNDVKTAAGLDAMAAAMKKDVTEDPASYEKEIVRKEADGSGTVRFEGLRLGAYLCWSEKRGGRAVHRGAAVV